MSTMMDNRRHKFINGKMRHVSGWRRSRTVKPPLALSVSFLDRFTRPSRAFLRRMDWIKIEDQGTLGSCVYNACSSAFEYVIRKQVGEDIQLSRLAGYAWGRDLAGVPLNEDSGSDNHTGMRVLSEIGLPPEKDWPYDLAKWNQEPDASARAIAGKHRLGLVFGCPTISTIEAALAQDFPVAIGFECFEDLMSEETAETGLIKLLPQNEIVGGHSVYLVGYDSKLQVFFLANSWGENWGTKPPEALTRGFAMLPYAYFKTGYADEALTPRTLVRG